MPSYVLQVNGTEHTVEAPAEMPLLWVLRDKLGLLGTRYGCGQGLCGRGGRASRLDGAR